MKQNNIFNKIFKTNKALFILPSILILVYGLIAYTNYNKDVDKTIIDFYNEKSRPAWKWENWEDSIEDYYYKIVKTKSSFSYPTYTVLKVTPPTKKKKIWLGGPGTSVPRKEFTVPEPVTKEDIANYNINNNEDTIIVDVVHFKRDPFLRLLPVDIIHGWYEEVTFAKAHEIAQETDISMINKNLSEDNPLYNPKVRVFTNPSKEEWIKKLETEKRVVKKEIYNPSKTDAIVYSERNDGREGVYILKSTDQNLYDEYSIDFFNFEPEKEDFTFWLNDEEFIHLIAKPEFQIYDEDKIAYYKKYPDGLYAFNVNTKESKPFILVELSTGETLLAYKLSDDNIAIYTTKRRYILSKNKELISNEPFNVE